MESLIITSTDKESLYKEIIPQIAAITSGEENLVANLANTAAILKEAFGFFWVGFYLVSQERTEERADSSSQKSELILGPFQGPLACTRIAYGKGVCGTAWKEKRTLVVEDVEKFPGHIACSSLSRSEIVVPCFNSENEVVAVLDIDSKELSSFDATDAAFLPQVADLLFK